MYKIEVIDKLKKIESISKGVPKECDVSVDFSFDQKPTILYKSIIIVSFKDVYILIPKRNEK